MLSGTFYFTEPFLVLCSAEMGRLLKSISFEIFPQKTKFLIIVLGHGEENDGMF